MALINPPAWLQQGSYSASLDRSVIAGLFRTGGVVDESHFVVTQTATPSLRLNVSAGHAYIEGTSVQNQGYYHIFNDAVVEVEFNPGALSLGRIDLLVLRILDADVAGSVNEARFEVIQGTPATIPSVPVRPASSIELARVTVNPGTSSSSGIVNSSINASFKPVASLAPGLVQSPRMVTSTTRPVPAPVSGTIYETDTQLTRTRVASGTWRHVGGSPTLYAIKNGAVSYNADWNRVLNWETKIDDLNMFDLASGRVLVPIAGIWQVDFSVVIGANPTATVIGSRIADSSNNQTAVATRDVRYISASQYTLTTRFNTNVSLALGGVFYPMIFHNAGTAQGFLGATLSVTLVRANDV